MKLFTTPSACPVNRPPACLPDQSAPLYKPIFFIEKLAKNSSSAQKYNKVATLKVAQKYCIRVQLSAEYIASGQQHKICLLHYLKSLQCIMTEKCGFYMLQKMIMIQHLVYSISSSPSPHESCLKAGKGSASSSES